MVKDLQSLKMLLYLKKNIYQFWYFADFLSYRIENAGMSM